MARPERKTVDYFPHYISDGKKMFFIEHKYGNDGYSTWFKILESLASTDNHFLNLNNKMDLMFLSAKCRVTDEVLLSILNDLSELGEIDHFLWLNKIVYSNKFIESIQDAYSRRSNKCFDYDSFCKHYSSLCTTITKFSYDKQYNNTQSKVNDTKEKKKKVDKIIPTNEEFLSYFRTIQEFDYNAYLFSVNAKYEQWVSNNWQDGNGNEIKNWKSKLKNTLPHLKPMYQNNVQPTPKQIDIRAQLGLTNRNND